MKIKGTGMFPLVALILITALVSCADITGDTDPDDPANPAETLVKIVISSMPDKLVYGLNESPDWTGLEVTGHYADGSTRTETIANSDISGFSSASAGAKTITVAKNGHTATFSVTVSGVTLVSISISSPPNKVVYELNESFDRTGLEVTGHYSDDSSRIETINNSDISGFSSTSEGEKTITVTKNGKKTTFAVTVSAVTLVSLSISAPPDKAVYEINDDPDWTGLTVIGTYSDGVAKFETIGKGDISGFDSTSAGIKTITITKRSKTVTFTVEILGKGSGGITILPFPTTTTDISLSQTGSTVVAPSGYENYQWFVDDLARPADDGSNGRAITPDTPPYSTGEHRVRVTAYQQGLPYSGEIVITLP
jgi:hypothetical protein